MIFKCTVGVDCVDRIESLSENDGNCPWQPRIVNARHFKWIDWTQESVLLVTISTAGDGKRL